jgi:hypothetical protein
MKKALRAFSRTTCVTTAAVRIPRSSTITQGRNGFMPPRQYCGGSATGMELRMRDGYIGRAATGLARRNKP